MLMMPQEHILAGDSDCGGMNWLNVVLNLETVPPRYLVVKEEHETSAKEAFAGMYTYQ